MTFLVFSLGCKVNSYECSAISSMLLKKGYEEAKTGQNPDVFIINTCSVTATADQKSRQHIRKFIKLYPHAISVVMGCYSQGNYHYISENIKPDILLGTSFRYLIPLLIEEFKNTHQPIVKVNDNTRNFTYEELGVTSFSENVRAYLKIQDGCDNFCSYCLIPLRRGKMRSRNKSDIINEAKYLISKGYKEIILTGIHVGGYGKDLKDTSFSSLVEELLDLPGLRSLRISSIEESEIDEHLINLYQSRKNLAPHIHIPLQSGSDTVLKRMNRKYTCQDFYDKLKKIRKALPSIALTSDVIVGFPGESEEEFNQTYNFIQNVGFNMLHVFPFSAREGTKAYYMENQISPDIKKQRVDKLITLSNKLWDEYCSCFVNKNNEVLIEKYDKENHISYGHTPNYIEVKIENSNADVGSLININLALENIIK